VDQWVAFVDADISRYNALILQLVKGSINPYNKPVRCYLLLGVFRANLLSDPHRFSGPPNFRSHPSRKAPGYPYVRCN
jgi:hypothetical protein